MAFEAGMVAENIRTFQNLQFYHDLGTAEEPELITVPYKKITGVRWG